MVFYYWIAGALYLLVGALVLSFITDRWPIDFDRLTGNNLIGILFSILIWPWSVAVIITLALTRKDDDRDEHEIY